ncbi:MAG: gamma-glutamyl-gamma-aminobutyrate hydrolase family protein, partial [Candidatus Stahlbacteria bacterium]|nr:gamma-glutamyl-gamma-aminobutyrate hydrolase family protein [Candidatus Stahlbacteria bacterium]
ITRAKTLVHGKISEIYHDGESIFKNIPNPFIATRYHSLAVDVNYVPDCLKISAYTNDGEIMGIRHKTHPVEGVQFHPESILTQKGKKLLENFLKI